MTDQTEAPQGRDPIFAAIERHKAARRAYENKAAELPPPGFSPALSWPSYRPP